MKTYPDYKLDLYEDIASGLEDHEVEKVRVGIHGVYVKSKNPGISLRYEGKKHVSVKDSGRLNEKNALELSEYIKSWDFTEASIGLAALNSLLEPEGERKDAFDFLDEVVSEEKKIGIIGYFPWAEKMKHKKNVWVLERKPPEGVYPDTSCEFILPKCDFVLITGSALVNKTLPRLLKLSKDAFTMVLGPSTPFSSKLFDYGVDAIAGSKIKEGEKVMKKIEEGATVCDVNDHLEQLIKFNPEAGEL